MEEKKSVFRKEMLDRLASPEKLDDYIKVSNPGMFTVLVAVVLLLITLVVWSFFRQVDTVITVTAVSDGQNLTAYLSESEAAHITENVYVKIEGNNFYVKYVPKTPVPASDVMDKYLLHVSGFSAEDWVCPVSLEGAVPEGIYQAKMIEESHSIISYLLN